MSSCPRIDIDNLHSCLEIYQVSSSMCCCVFGFLIIGKSGLRYSNPKLVDTKNGAVSDIFSDIT